MDSVLVLKKWHHWVKSWLFGALPACWYYGWPGHKVRVFGITGTDGKTTSSTLLYHALKKSGRKVALISTVAAFIGDEAIDTGFHVTSPEPWLLQKLLRRCVDAGIEDVVLEVTAHGIFQYRIWGVPFQLAGLTNISREHLDYFRTYEQYAAVKAEFLCQAQKAVINGDDSSFKFVQHRLRAAHAPYRVFHQDGDTAVVTAALVARFPELYNRWNGQLVWAMAQELGVSQEDMVTAIKNFPGVIGRMERVGTTARGAMVIVDFAHTPNALLQALRTLRPQTKGKLIAVFGSAGLRDRSKRPAMGKIGAECADLAIFTAEDPRTEDVNVIIRQMKEGVQAGDHRKVVSIPDRGAAIGFALKEARRGDIVGIFGKGHEQSMCFGTVETPWSDQVHVRHLLEEGA